MRLRVDYWYKMSEWQWYYETDSLLLIWDDNYIMRLTFKYWYKMTVTLWDWLLTVDIRWQWHYETDRLIIPGWPGSCPSVSTGHPPHQDQPQPQWCPVEDNSARPGPGTTRATTLSVVSAHQRRPDNPDIYTRVHMLVKWNVSLNPKTPKLSIKSFWHKDKKLDSEESLCFKHFHMLIAMPGINAIHSDDRKVTGNTWLFIGIEKKWKNQTSNSDSDRVVVYFLYCCTHWAQSSPPYQWQISSVQCGHVACIVAK